MTAAQLIAKLSELDPNAQVLLTVGDALADLEAVTFEQDHGSEEMFVRLYGDEPDDPA